MHPDSKSPLFPQSKKIMIIAGEASGDLHGSNLVKEMLLLDPSLTFYGIGGEKLRDAGVELVAHSSDMAVVGLTEVASKLWFILGVLKKIKRSLRASRPDLLILIDYPDFNFPVARAAKNYGIKVFYYISPQIWAWRKGRISTLKKTVDRMAVILPFEEDVYGAVDLDVSFVGHPLLDAVKTKYTREEALKYFDIRNDFPIVGILPGSRKSEVIKLLPEMLKAAKKLKNKIPSVQFILPLANSLPFDFVSEIVCSQSVDVKITSSNGYDAVALSDVAMVASGTATLETALLETPMIIAYKISTLSYFLGRIFIHVDHIGLVNIIGGKTIVPEFIQNDANSENMANELFDIITDHLRRKKMRKELAKVREKLGNSGAAKRVAELAYEMLRQ